MDDNLSDTMTPEPEGPPPKPYARRITRNDAAAYSDAKYYHFSNNKKSNTVEEQDSLEDTNGSILSSPSSSKIVRRPRSNRETDHVRQPPPSFVAVTNKRNAPVRPTTNEDVRLVSAAPSAEEDETFYDDRSLEERLHQALSKSPALAVIAASQSDEPPSSVPPSATAASRLARAQEEISKLQHEKEQLLLHQYLPNQQKTTTKAHVSRPGDSLPAATPLPNNDPSKAAPTSIVELAHLTSQVQMLQETNAQLSKENRSLHSTLVKLEGEARTDTEGRPQEVLHPRRTTASEHRHREETVVESLRTENTRLQNKVKMLQKKLEDVNDKLVKVTSQKVGLEAQLLNKETNKTKSKGILRKSHHKGVQTTASSQATSSASMDCVDEGKRTEVSYASGNKPTINASMGDRLGRIREATERASAVQQHQRDMARLVEEHRVELHNREREFADGKKKFIELTRTQYASRCKELKKRLQGEFDKRIQELEQRHASEISQLKEETIGTSMAHAAHQVDLEVTRRQELEARLEDAQKDHAQEKKAMIDQHASEIESLTSEWNNDKGRLLDFIRRECNSVFDRSWSTSVSSPGYGAMSPPSLECFFLEGGAGEKDVLASLQTTSTSKDGSRSPKCVIESPTSKLDLSQSLRETEAFVEMVLGGRQ